MGMLPLFDPLLQDSFGIFLLNSLPGSLQIQAHNYVAMERITRTSVEPLKMVDQLPGDSPLVARFSFPEEDFQGFLSDGVDSVLRFLSANKLGADTELPGFDLSARELLKFPSGDFVLAGETTGMNRYRCPQVNPLPHSLQSGPLALKFHIPLPCGN